MAESRGLGTGRQTRGAASPRPEADGRAQAAAALDETLIRELERLMRDMIALYEAMSTAALERRRAMRAADRVALGTSVERENLAVQGLAELEKRRVLIVGALAERLGSPQRAHTTMTWIASQLPEPTRGRLTELAQSLRDLIERVVKENSAARRAAEMLAGHMEGLMRNLTATLNHARTYGRMGAVGPGARVVSAIDLTS